MVDILGAILPDWLLQTFVGAFLVSHFWGFCGFILLGFAWFAAYKIKVPAKTTALTKMRIRTIKTVRITGVVMIAVELIPIFAGWFEESLEWLEDRSGAILAVIALQLTILIFMFYKHLKSKQITIS